MKRYLGPNAVQASPTPFFRLKPPANRCCLSLQDWRADTGMLQTSEYVSFTRLRLIALISRIHTGISTGLGWLGYQTTAHLFLSFCSPWERLDYPNIPCLYIPILHLWL